MTKWIRVVFSDMLMMGRGGEICWERFGEARPRVLFGFVKSEMSNKG